MAKSDSSAVQKLIELAQQKPLELDVDLDGLFAEDTRARNARHALPPPRRSAAASMSPSSALPPLPRTRAPVSTHTGFQAPVPTPTPSRPLPRLGAVAEPTSPLDLADLSLRDDDVPRTQQTPRRASVAPWIIAGAFALGVGFAGVYLVAEGLEQTAATPDRQVAASVAAAVAPAVVTPTVAPVAAVEPAPAPAAPTPALAAAPTPALAAAPAPAAAAITVSFLSRPAGASVILVENGSMTPLGKTPLTAPLPAGTKHEVLFTLEGRATVLAHVDPATQTEVSVELAAGAVEPAAAPAPAAVEPPVRIVREERPSRDDDRAKRASREHKPEKRVAAAPSGRGTLMLGAKPPCEIIVDGKSTGLTTPQREIPLPAGKRIITLVNKQHGIKKSFAVMVTAGDTVKVIKDLTELMK